MHRALFLQREATARTYPMLDSGFTEPQGLSCLPPQPPPHLSPLPLVQILSPLQCLIMLALVSVIADSEPSEILTHVPFREEDDDDLEETSFAFLLDTKANDVDPMIITYPGNVFVRRPVRKSISWLAMTGWEYIEHAQLSANGRYGFCSGSKTLDRTIDNCVIVLKFGATVESRVVRTPGYPKEDTVLHIEQHDVVVAVCENTSTGNWTLVHLDLKQIFADSEEEQEVGISLMLLPPIEVCVG